MKRIGTCFAVCATVVCALAVLAVAESDSTGQDQASGMPQMGAPAEMKHMEHLVGTWTADFKMRMDPNADWIVSPCTQKFEMILNGCALRAHFSSTVMGMPFNGEMTMTYNRETGKWQATWIDDMGARQTYMSGGMNDAGQMVLEGEDTQMGHTYLMKDITTPKSDSEFDWQMDVSFDGGKTWFTQMKATYRKQS